MLAELAARPVDPALPTIVLRFLTSPVRILGDDRVTGVEVVRNRLEPDAAGEPAVADRRGRDHRVRARRARGRLPR